jgi:hypothetical protein
MPSSVLTQRVDEVVPLLKLLAGDTKGFPLDYQTFFSYTEEAEFYRNFYTERAASRILVAIDSGNQYWQSTKTRERDKIKEIIRGAMDAKLV